jgi:hypothetical protein
LTLSGRQGNEATTEEHRMMYDDEGFEAPWAYDAFQADTEEGNTMTRKPDITDARYAIEDLLTAAQRELDAVDDQILLLDEVDLGLVRKSRRLQREVANLTDRLREADEEITEIIRADYEAECVAEAARPWGEQQEQVNWLESRYDSAYGED